MSSDTDFNGEIEASESRPNVTDLAEDSSSPDQISKSKHTSGSSRGLSSNSQQIIKLVQISQKQSSDLEGISESIKELQSSVDKLRDRMETMESENAVVVEWANRKIAKKEKRRRAKEERGKKTKQNAGRKRP